VLENGDWNHLVHNRIQWQAVVATVMKFRLYEQWEIS